MSRTIRRDRKGKKYSESLKKREGHYRCRCSRCARVTKRNAEEAMGDKDLELELKDWHDPDAEWEEIRSFHKKRKENFSFEEWDWEQEYWAKQEDAA